MHVILQSILLMTLVQVSIISGTQFQLVSRLQARLRFFLNTPRMTIVDGCIPEVKIPDRPVTRPDRMIKEEDRVVGCMVNSWKNLFHSRPLNRFSMVSRLKFRRKRSFRFSSGIVRKEFRQLSGQQRELYARVLDKLKNAKPPAKNYDDFVAMHDYKRAPAAHFGAPFLAWHRHYIHLFEQELRRLCPRNVQMFVPYWDPALDADLNDPKDSILWTPEFFGTPQGVVTQGLGKNWIASEDCQNIGRNLKRSLNGDKDFLFSREKIASLLSAKSYYELMGRAEGLPISQFELDHGLVHCYAGGCSASGCDGHIGCVSCSPNDPVFWSLHAFVDLLWHEWSKLPNRTNVYPVPGVGGATLEGMGDSQDYLKDAPMKPFLNMKNGDGMRKGVYSIYSTRPSKLKCRLDSHCRGFPGLLFCHGCECFSKIKPGGNCTTFGNKACYCPTGYRGVCVADICKCQNVAKTTSSSQLIQWGTSIWKNLVG